MSKEHITKNWAHYDPEDDELNNICMEAHYRARLYQRGVRGQAIMPQDSIEFWIYAVTKELYEG